MRTALFVVTVIAFAIAYVLWIRVRRRQIRFPVATDITPETIAGLTWSRVIEGNHVTIVQNSEFFTEFLNDVARAAHHVHLETFLWQATRISPLPWSGRCRAGTTAGCGIACTIASA